MSVSTRDLITASLASTFRFWQGTMGSSRQPQQESLPILFDREGDPDCRLVREALTALNLDVEVRPVPRGGTHFAGALLGLCGTTEIPALYEPETEQSFVGARSILAHLYSQWGKGPVPAWQQPTRFNRALANLVTTTRGNRGLKARGRAAPIAEPLVLYTFESSPYSRPVRELMSELEIPYRLITLCKQKVSDLGPAVQRFHLGEYEPLPDSKRSRFLAKHGRVQVPYLEDPNTGMALFESAHIVEYLEQTYGQADEAPV